MSSRDLVKVSVSPETFGKIIAQVATYISVNEYLTSAETCERNYFETLELKNQVPVRVDPSRDTSSDITNWKWHRWRASPVVIFGKTFYCWGEIR
jgi:hypothetical protein